MKIVWEWMQYGANKNHLTWAQSRGFYFFKCGLGPFGARDMGPENPSVARCTSCLQREQS